MNKIYLIGHKSPDLDAVVSTVGYAEFLKRTNRYIDFDIVPAITEEPNEETKYIFEKFKVEIPLNINHYEIDDSDSFILCDHNEASQRHEKVNNEKVIEIIDHHKLNINFNKPIRLDIKPFGSTSTLIYEHFDVYDIEPTKETMGLLLSAILSDTQGLKSSTTTGYDSKVVDELSGKLNLNIKELTLEIFKAKSDISALNIEELVKKDYKVFEFGNKKIFINQIETVEQNSILEKKEQIVQQLNKIKTELKVDQTFNVVTDVLEVNSKVIFETKEEENIIEQAFLAMAKDNVADIGPKMSRKKDIAPPIEKVIEKNE
jgi:manganese-dependent inorganic pyrophosphatase